MNRDIPDWAGRRAPSLSDFEELARAAYNGLPEDFRALTQDVGFVVAELPEEEVLRDLGLRSPYELLGLFHGVGRAQFGDQPFTGQMPNRIWLYRRPILAYWHEHPDQTLAEIVTHVLIHEVGHHFGLSDEDMEELEAEAAREDGDEGTGEDI